MINFRRMAGLALLLAISAPAAAQERPVLADVFKMLKVDFGDQHFLANSLGVRHHPALRASDER